MGDILYFKSKVRTVKLKPHEIDFVGIALKNNRNLLLPRKYHSGFVKFLEEIELDEYEE